jgi:hypothetical protein
LPDVAQIGPDMSALSANNRNLDFAINEAAQQYFYVFTASLGSTTLSCTNCLGLKTSSCRVNPAARLDACRISSAYLRTGLSRLRSDVINSL